MLPQSEEAIRRDQEEREQLERNIKERDAAATRKVYLAFKFFACQT